MQAVRILFVEGSDDEVFIASYRLQRAGLSVEARVVADARELPEAVATWPPNVIVCGTRLDGFDDDSTLKAAEEFAPEVPVIVVSSERTHSPWVAASVAQNHALVHRENAEELIATIVRMVPDNSDSTAS